MVPINLFVLGWVLHAGAKVLGSLIPFAEWVGHDTLAQLALGSLDGASVLGLGCALISARLRHGRRLAGCGLDGPVEVQPCDVRRRRVRLDRLSVGRQRRGRGAG